jgi:uncharacterized repeat protein (TIGR03803 family)
MKNEQLWSLMIRVCAVLTVVVMSASVSWAITGYTKVYSFTGGVDGRDPATALTFDSAGNAYGTTAAGGDFDLGAVFQLTPSGGGWVETVIYSFTGGNDGSDPHGGVILGADGNLYGTAVAGGSGGICTGDGCGVVYKLTPFGGQWSETTLYSFKGGTDGWGPGGRVVFDAAGNLFGTTPNGGRHSFGTIFKLTPTMNGTWDERVIHSFTGGKDGATGSLGDLIFDAAGNIYGVAEQGGANGAGTVYKLSHSPTGGWILTTLYAFKGMPDAAFPFGGLIFDANGNLYGTTYFGGTAGMGTVFQLAPGPNGTWQENILYSFLGGTDGSLPTSTLIFDSRGRLFGTTSAGGRLTCDCGTVFRLTLFGGSWNERIVHLFGGSDGFAPNYGLTFNPAGDLYGATPAGGTFHVGMIFKFTP